MIPITSPETLGKVLRRYRKDQGLSQTEAGGKLNIPQKTVSHVESGLPGVQINTLFNLLAALNLEMRLEARGQNPASEEMW